MIFLTPFVILIRIYFYNDYYQKFYNPYPHDYIYYVTWKIVSAALLMSDDSAFNSAIVFATKFLNYYQSFKH